MNAEIDSLLKNHGLANTEALELDLTEIRKELANQANEIHKKFSSVFMEYWNAADELKKQQPNLSTSALGQIELIKEKTETMMKSANKDCKKAVEVSFHILFQNFITESNNPALKIFSR